MTEERITAETQQATLGGGCFWCLEAIFQQVDGVLDVTSGYAGGHVADPSYRQVCSGETGHAEVVQVRFDPQRVTYRELLELFFRTHDPTTPGRQGADVGPQYRSIILWHDREQERAARRLMDELDDAGVFDGPIVTELIPLERFYPAEDEHHRFYERNPEQVYCRIVIRPKLGTAREFLEERGLAASHPQDDRSAATPEQGGHP
ncbi:MAG: peptide-methionine (S)-S-oxide reductase MsrA [bacterium]